MSHCSRTLPSPQHPNQLTPFPKKATNIYGMTFLAFQAQWIPSLQQCKASLWGTASQHGLEVAMKINKIQILMNKDTLCWEAFFPWELYGPSNPAAGLLQSLSSDAWGRGRPNSSLLNLEGQRCLTENTNERQNVLMAKAGLVFSTTKYFRTNLAAEKWEMTTWTAEFTSCGRDAAASCLLLIGGWVGWVPAFLCQLCCQHAPAVPPGPGEPQDRQHNPPGCAHSHTQGRHTAGTLERKEERAICLANFSASILMAANSNSSCQRGGWGGPHGEKNVWEQRKKCLTC